MPENSPQLPTDRVPSKPGLISHLAWALGWLLLIAGSLGVVVNLIGLAIATTRSGPGTIGNHIRASESLAAGAAAATCFVVLVVPGWFLCGRVRKQTKAWEAYAGLPGRPISAKAIILVSGGICAGLFLLLLIWFFRDSGSPTEVSVRGRSSSEWLNALRSPDTTAREHACEELVASGSEAVPVLIDALGDADAEVRNQAAIMLNRLGGASAPAAPALIAALHDASIGVRIEAAGALGNCDAEPNTVVPALVESLDDEHEWVREVVGNSLRTIGKAAIPSITELLRDRERGSTALQALAVLKADGAEATAAVVEVLKHDEPILRMQAAITLSRIAQADDLPVPALIEALSDPSYLVRREVADCLVWSNAPQAINARVKVVPVLVEVLKDEEALFRERAALNLGMIGGLAQGAIPALGEAAQDPEPTVREAATAALDLIRSQVAGEGHDP